MSRTTWNFSSAGRVLFGCGALRELGPAVRRLNVQRVLLMTDRALVQAGIVDRAAHSLHDAGLHVEIFDGGEPEPSFGCADAAITAARRAAPDAIIGLGGGSNMDLAKITAAVMTHDGPYRDYVNFDNVPGPVLPLICVPTTSGTGSEVSHAAVLTDRDNSIKVSTLSPYLRPALAVVDPELTLTCPPRVTADSGIDALTHAIEACTATHSCDMPVSPGTLTPYEGQGPLTDALAEQAIRGIATHLATAVREPTNLDARTGMSLAATTAGLAFSNAAVALVHAMEYPMGGELHCSHGAGNGLLLPHVLRYILPARTQELARIATWLGVATRGPPEDAAAQAAIDAVDALRQAIGVPARIRDIGGREDQLSRFAAKAFAIKRLMTLTPRAVTEADILGIYQAAF